MTPTELWLPIGAAAFYLYDSCLLLWQNEMVFIRGRCWIVSGGTQFRLGGRRVFLPNPLLPMRPQFQLRWSVEDPRAAAGNDLAALLRALRPVGVINQLQLALLLALPVIAWTQGAGLPLLALFALFYVLTLVALAMIWHQRGALGLPARAFWLQALDALACAPFAVNLTRRISLRHGIAGDPLQFAAQQLDPPARDALRQLIAARLQEEQAVTGESSAARLALLLSRLE